jgi:hypothetical protein
VVDPSSNLYAGGEFTTAGITTINRIAKIINPTASYFNLNTYVNSKYLYNVGRGQMINVVVNNQGEPYTNGFV